MDKIFFVITANKYPEGDAGSVRQHAFSYMLKDAGYIPIVIGLGDNTKFSEQEYDGIRYYSFRYPKNNIISKVRSHLFFKRNLKKLLKRYNFSDIKGVLFVSGRDNTLKFIKKYFLNKNIQLYHDSVEWYSPSEFAKGEKAKGYIKNNKLNTEWIDDKFKVFAISSFLEEHFKNRGIESIRIPVIMDTKKIAADKETNADYIKIVYAGQMGKKDKIINFIKALPMLSDEELDKLKVFLIGMTKESFENQNGIIDSRIEKTITFTGRIPRQEVLNHLKSADFTMLLRPEDERYAMAGFPTKVVESLSTATPVICNYTSDLNMYLKDGENSVIVKGTTVEDCLDALKKAVNLSFEERKQLQINARKTAEKEFDYRVYTDSVKEFIL